MADVITKWSEFYLTEKGLEMRQKVIAEGVVPRFVYAKIGEGVPAIPANIPLMTDLVSPSEQVAVTRSYAVQKTHYLDVYIDNKDFQQEIFMREIGVFAKLADSDEVILYGYSYTLQGYEPIPTGDTFHRTWRIGANTGISRSSNIVIVYDGSQVYVTVEEFDATQPTQEIATVVHNLGEFPGFALYAGSNAAGVGGYGESGYGGSSFISVPAKFELLNSNSVRVYTVPQFAGNPEVSKITDTRYALIYPGSLESLFLNITR